MRSIICGKFKSNENTAVGILFTTDRFINEDVMNEVFPIAGRASANQNQLTVVPSAYKCVKPVKFCTNHFTYSFYRVLFNVVYDFHISCFYLYQVYYTRGTPVCVISKTKRS